MTRNIFSRQFVVSIFLLVFCFLSMSQTHVEGGRLTEDEQNTIEVFKKASRRLGLLRNHNLKSMNGRVILVLDL